MKGRTDSMLDPMELQQRYFTAQLERFRNRPGLHRALIEDCEYYLEMLEDAGSPAAFKALVQQTGNMLSTAKANAEDRCSNRAHIYHKLGHHRKVEEDRQRQSIIEEARTHAELFENLEAFERETTLGRMENQALGALGPMMDALFHLCTDRPGGTDHDRSMTKLNEYMKQLTEADPDFTWQKLMTHRPYRDRLPFTDRQLAILENRFREVTNG
jgi:hypothetical protein